MIRTSDQHTSKRRCRTARNRVRRTCRPSSFETRTRSCIRASGMDGVRVRTRRSARKVRQQNEEQADAVTAHMIADLEARDPVALFTNWKPHWRIEPLQRTARRTKTITDVMSASSRLAATSASSPRMRKTNPARPAAESQIDSSGQVLIDRALHFRRCWGSSEINPAQQV